MYKQYTIHTVSTYTDMVFFGEVKFKKEDFSTKKWGSIQEECSKIGHFTFTRGSIQEWGCIQVDTVSITSALIYT